MTALVPLACFAWFAAWRLLTYLHLFQQEEYDGRRFLRWLWRERSIDWRLSLPLLAFFAFHLIPQLPLDNFDALIGFACLLAAGRARDPRKTAKKQLAMTARATRIYWSPRR